MWSSCVIWLKRAIPLTSSDIHAPQRSCEGCPFRGPRVGSKGDPASPIVFVAESPGRQEVQLKEPLVGPSGRIFHQFVPEEYGYILNALECYPLAALKDEKRMNHAVSCCRGNLLEKVSAHPRRIIVAMGNAAVRSLTGDYKLKITQIRGRLIRSELAEVGIMPIVHIAALMRGGGSFRQWKQDIQYALDLAEGMDEISYVAATVKIVAKDIDRAGLDSIFADILAAGRTPGEVPSVCRLTGDIETSGLDHINDRILSVGITPDNDTSISYCFYPEHFAYLKPYIESGDIEWNWHNGKFDVKFLHQAGLNARVDEDTMLLSYTLDESGGVHDLETVSHDTIGAPDYKHMIQPYLPNKQASYELVPEPILAEYQAIDTANTARIRPILRRRVARHPDLEKLYTKTLLPASPMLAWVENNGIHVDVDRIQDNTAYFDQMKAEVSAEAYELTGHHFNLGSPQQVSRLLFKGYKFPNRAKGSTAEDVLKRLQRDTEHPIFNIILRYRKAVKMNGTYVNGYLKHVHPETHRIHTTFLLHGTRTGRLASRQPNIQNVPRDIQIRGEFTAAPGYVLVEVDLSQAELRSLTVVSGDPVLLEIYLNDGDIHTELAKSLYPGWPDNRSKEVAKEQRVKCKNVNFGIIYGITKFGLQEQIRGTLDEAQWMLDGWFDRFQVAGKFIKRCRNTPTKNQIITTCFGRKKRVGLVTKGTLNFLQNEAANFPHQSIASDITLHTAIRTYKQLDEWGIRIVNLVHDSIIMEVPITPGDELQERAIGYVGRTFEQVPRDWGLTAIPFKADAEYGHRWGSLKEYEGDAING